MVSKIMRQFIALCRNTAVELFSLAIALGLAGLLGFFGFLPEGIDGVVASAGVFVLWMAVCIVTYRAGLHWD
jgi:hypothetical protein